MKYKYTTTIYPISSANNELQEIDAKKTKSKKLKE